MSSAPPSPDQAIRYRSGQQARLIGAITCIVVVAVAIGTGQALTDPQVHPSVLDRVLGVGLLGAMACAFAAFGIRAVLTGVLVHRDGITVRNLRRSRRLTWNEIDRFSLEPIALSTIGCVHLRDGEKVMTWGIQGPNRFVSPKSSGAIDAIAELNAILQQSRSNL
jgi:Bacterial PH domain